jgi:uncharacterized protein (DUF302 family)
MTPSVHGGEIVELLSSGSFERTLDLLLDGAAAAGLQLFARIDHAALAAAAGLAMPPATVLLYGNPKGGTPVMVAVPAVALDLPLRLLIRQDDTGRTRVSYHPIETMLRDAGGCADMARRLAPAQAWIASAIGA